MYILSIDCATKTLGYVFAEIDNKYYLDIIDFFKKLKTIIDKKLKLENIEKIQNEIIQFYERKFINILSADVIDIINGKKIKDVPYIQILNNLHNNLDEIFNKIINCKSIKDKINKNNNWLLDFYVILENQWNISTQNNIIASAIAMYMISRIQLPMTNIIDISPTRKNKIYFDESLSMDNFKKLYPQNTKYNRYNRCKKHAIENMEFYLNNFKIRNSISHIKKSDKSHIADAFMQMMVFLLENKKIQI